MTERDRDRGEGPEPLDEQAAWEQIVAGYGERPTPPPAPGVWHPDAVADGPADDAASRRGSPPREGRDEADTAEPRSTETFGDSDDAGEGRDRTGGTGGTEPGEASGSDGTDRTGGASEAGGSAGTGSTSARVGPTDDRPGGPVDFDDPEQAVRAGGVNDASQWSGLGPRDWGPSETGDEDHFVPPDPGPPPPTDLITRFAWIGVIGGPVMLVGAAILGLDITWWMTTLGIGGFLGGFATLVLGMRDDRDDEWTDPGSGAVV